MSSAVYDNVLFTYMGLREDNNFSLFLQSPDGKDVFEDLLKDTGRLAGLFGILSDRDKLAIITYLNDQGHISFRPPQLPAGHSLYFDTPA